MSYREIVSQELAKLLGVLSHHDRIFIIEELYKGEREVKSLQQKLNISHSRVSQHLSLLRSHHVVTERRRGRNVLYRLVNPELSIWLMEALRFIEFRLQHTDEILNAVESARTHWLNDDDESAASTDDNADESLIYITGRNAPPKKPPPK